MQEFKVNQYLSLRLEKGKTNIYVAGEMFRQCKRLIVEISVNEVNNFSEIKSIDSLFEKQEIFLEELKHNIPPEVEFWGHCSNLQVWEEYNYDTRLLHSNLAFPLLKKLADVGDSIAKSVFKEEIVRRIGTGVPSVVEYLIEEFYLQFLCLSRSNLAIMKRFLIRSSTFPLRIEKILDCEVIKLSIILNVYPSP